MAKEYSSKSKFTAGAFANYFATLLVGLVSSVTFGLATPWILCWYMRFIADHTFINGKRVEFTGTGGSLFGNYIKWLLLSIITFGIYWLVAGQVNLAKWLAKNAHLEGYNKDGESQSDFTGKWYQMWGVSILASLLTTCTLGIGYSWAICYVIRWYAAHVTVDGHEMEFDGTGGQLIGKMILWCFLTLITFGIFSFWLTVKTIKWLVSHIHLAHPEELAESDKTEDADSNADAAASSDAAPAKSQTNILAILGLVLPFVVPFMGSIAGLICSIMGLKKSDELGMKGIAIGGLVVSILAMLVYVITFGVAVVLMMGNVGEIEGGFYLVSSLAGNLL